MKNVLKPLAKSVLIHLELTAAAAAAAAAASVTDPAIHKKMFGSGHPFDLASLMTTLIVSNEEMNDIMKIVKSFRESTILVIIFRNFTMF